MLGFTESTLTYWQVLLGKTNNNNNNMIIIIIIIIIIMKTFINESAY